MKEKRCKDCILFLQHYVKHNGNFITVRCGHCIHKRIKKRNPDDIACEYYNDIFKILNLPKDE